jgi:hypothetical protein
MGSPSLLSIPPPQNPRNPQNPPSRTQVPVSTWGSGGAGRVRRSHRIPQNSQEIPRAAAPRCHCATAAPGAGARVADRLVGRGAPIRRAPAAAEPPGGGEVPVRGDGLRPGLPLAPARGDPAWRCRSAKGQAYANARGLVHRDVKARERPVRRSPTSASRAWAGGGTGTGAITTAVGGAGDAGPTWRPGAWPARPRTRAGTCSP